MNDIEAQQADLHRRMEENIDSGGSEEEYDAVVAKDEALTAAKAGARGLASTAQAKDVNARIKETRATLEELTATRPANDQEKYHRMTALQEQTQRLADLEFQAPFAGRPDDSLATEREESQIAVEEAKEALKTLPSGSARRRREEARLNEARDRAAHLATELGRRRNEAATVKGRQDLIARMALREAAAEFHNAQAKQTREELKRIEGHMNAGRADWIDLERAKAQARDAHQLPVPPELVEAKARQIASRTDLDWLTP